MCAEGGPGHISNSLLADSDVQSASSGEDYFDGDFRLLHRAKPAQPWNICQGLINVHIQTGQYFD